MLQRSTTQLQAESHQSIPHSHRSDIYTKVHEKQESNQKFSQKSEEKSLKKLELITLPMHSDEEG